MCMSVLVLVPMSAGALRDQKKALGKLELEFRAGCGVGADHTGR